MNKEQYIGNLLADGIEFIDDNYDIYDTFDDLYDEMELVITGNDNGSYYCNTAKAEEALAGVIWDQDVIDAVRWLGYESIPLSEGAESADVIVRIALMNEVTNRLKNYYEELKEDDK